MPNFSEMARLKPDELPEVPLVPRGSYVARVSKLPDQGPTRNEDYTMITFPFEIIEPLGDVDEDELESFGKISGVRMYHRHLYPEHGEDPGELERQQKSSMKRLETLLYDHMEIDRDKSIEEALSSCMNQQVVIHVEHSPDRRDPDVVRAEIKSTAPVE